VVVAALAVLHGRALSGRRCSLRGDPCDSGTGRLECGVRVCVSKVAARKVLSGGRSASQTQRGQKTAGGRCPGAGAAWTARIPKSKITCANRIRRVGSRANGSVFPENPFWGLESNSKFNPRKVRHAAGRQAPSTPGPAGRVRGESPLDILHHFPPGCGWGGGCRLPLAVFFFFYFIFLKEKERESKRHRNPGIQFRALEFKKLEIPSGSGRQRGGERLPHSRSPRLTD